MIIVAAVVACVLLAALAVVLVGYFALGIVVNGISRSLPERLVMTPVVTVLAVCCLVVALD